MDVAHPQNLAPGWWESELADMVVELSQHHDTLRRLGKNGVHSDLFERARLACEVAALHAKVGQHIAQCVSIAQEHFANAVMAFEAETVEPAKVRALGHMARTQTDLDMLLRLVTVYTEGSTRKLYAEMIAQISQRKERVSDLRDLPELDEYKQGWIAMTNKVVELIAQYGPHGQEFLPDVYRALHDLRAFGYVASITSPRTT